MVSIHRHKPADGKSPRPYKHNKRSTSESLSWNSHVTESRCLYGIIRQDHGTQWQRPTLSERPRASKVIFPSMRKATWRSWCRRNIEHDHSQLGAQGMEVVVRTNDLLARPNATRFENTRGHVKIIMQKTVVATTGRDLTGGIGGLPRALRD